MEAGHIIDQLESALQGGIGLLPEIVLLCGAVLLLIFELFRPRTLFFAKTATTLLVLLLTGMLLLNLQHKGGLFSGMLISDDLSLFLSYVFLGIVGLVLLFPKRSNDLRAQGEYHFLLLTLLLGAFLVSKATNLIVFYLAVELISISSYILTAFAFQKKNFEAGIKYLLFGALASGVMLYGMSLLYGFSGTLEIGSMVEVSMVNRSGLFTLASVFFLVGVFFKLAIVPMHLWVPDVYEATPPSILAVFSTIPKLAVVAFLLRLIQVFGETGLGRDLIVALSVLALISMFAGNLSAIWQQNIKRLMGYSSIAHAGFLLVGVVVGSAYGVQALLFYGVVYSVMNVGTFYFIELMERGGLDRLEHYAGVGRSIPLLGVTIVVLMIALTGLPPTGGFTAKFLIFSALWESYVQFEGAHLFWLFVLGLVNTVIALFYYLRIPYTMIFKDLNTDKPFVVHWQVKIVLICFGFVMLALFFKADLLVNIINKLNFAL